MTASFISSRKQDESFTLKHHCLIIISFYKDEVMDKDIYKDIYQKRSYGSDVPIETYPPPSSIPEHLGP